MHDVGSSVVITFQAKLRRYIIYINISSNYYSYLIIQGKSSLLIARSFLLHLRDTSAHATIIVLFSSYTLDDVGSKVVWHWWSNS